MAAVTATGYDYAFNHPSEAWLAANADFVCRYLYPRSQYDAKDAKNLSKTEADRLIKLGLVICSNFESWASRAAEGYAAGVADARDADAQHRDCGGPADRPIYFSVDFDPTDMAPVAQYFRGVNSVIGLTRSGAYGSYKTVKYLLDNNLIKWAWQTYAWSYGQYDERCHVSQDQNGLSVGGGEADLDHAHTADYGQWPGAIQEDDMPYTEAQLTAIVMTGVRRVLTVQDKMTVASGMLNNDRVFEYVVSSSQQAFNQRNEIVAGVRATIVAVGAQADDEEVILAAIAAIPTVDFPPDQVAALAADLADAGLGTVDEDRLAAALSHSVVDAIAAALASEHPAT